MSDKFEEMRINKCKYHNTPTCPHYDKKEMEKTYWGDWQNLAVEEKVYKEAENMEEALQKSNELYCKECKEYMPTPDTKRNE